ncbi:MAG: hypothetical protein ACRD98_00460 [Nitrososphaera sp.]
MAIGTATAIGLGISAAATVGSGLASAGAAGGAAESQRDASERAGALFLGAGEESQRITREAAERYGQSLGLLDPYLEAGSAGRGLIAEHLGLEDLYTLPPYASPPRRGGGSYKGMILPSDVDPGRFAAEYEKMSAAHAGRYGFGLDVWRQKWGDQFPGLDHLYNVGRISPAEYQAEEAKAQAQYKKRGAALAAKKKEAIARGTYGRALQPFTLADFEKEPGYEFRRSEGLRDLSNLYGSRGEFLSGNALRGLSQFSQDYASGEYGKAYTRDLEFRTRPVDYGFRLLGGGQQAAGQRIAGEGSLAQLRGAEADLVQETARHRAGIQQDIGNISAAERVAKAQAYSNLFNLAPIASGYYASTGRGRYL